jgi:5-hydroxyisourate hydrolase-like protein (transthyretin family)
MENFLHRKTNEDGRLTGLTSKEGFTPGMYKMYFDTSSYFKDMNIITFYPYVEVWIFIYFLH